MLRLESFHRDRNLRYGRRYTCKQCANKRARYSRKQLITATSGLYEILLSMKKRCYNPKHKSYPSYGGRGIRICDTWFHTPGAFYSWAGSNGYHPDLQIDRIDNNGDYCPTNCRWVTPKKNTRSRPATKLNIRKVSVTKELLRRGYKQKGIGRLFKVTSSTISNIKSGKLWGDVV